MRIWVAVLALIVSVGTTCAQTGPDALRKKLDEALAEGAKLPASPEGDLVASAFQSLADGSLLEEYEPSLDELRKIIPKLDSKRQPKLRNLALAIYREAANRAGRIREWRDAIARGDEALRARRYDAAIEAYNSVADVKGEEPEERLTELARRGRMRALTAKQATPKPPEQMEREEKFEDAASSWKQLVPETDPHLVNLQKLLALRKQGEQASGKSRQEAVREAYDTFLKSLDPARDEHILRSAWKDREAIAGKLETAADVVVDGHFQRAQSYEKKREYKKAADVHDEALKEAGASQDKLQKARRERARLLARDVAGETWGDWGLKIWHSLVDLFWILMRYGAYFLIVIPVYLAGRWLIRLANRAFARPGITIEMTDTIPVTPARAQDAPGLCRELKWLLETRVGATGAGGLADPQRDLDGSGFGNLALSIPAQDELSVYIPDGDKLSVGPFQFPIRLLYTLFVSVWKRPFARRLRGSAAVFNGATVVQLELVDLHGKRISQEEGLQSKWEARCEGTAVSTALEQMSSQVLFGQTPPGRRLTANWKSLWRLRQGLLLLRPSETADQAAARLAIARQALEQAVLEDSRNWVARFHLAQTLRKLAENDLALHHLELLLTQGLHDPRMRQFVMEVEPTFFLLVLYQKGILLTKLNRFAEAGYVFQYVLRCL